MISDSSRPSSSIVEKDSTVHLWKRESIPHEGRVYGDSDNYEPIGDGVYLYTAQGKSQRLLKSSLPAADLTAEMEAMAQRHVSMDDSFHLPNFPHMAYVDPSALPALAIMPVGRSHWWPPEAQWLCAKPKF